MLYETFLTLGLFRLLFCRTSDQAVLFLFCLPSLPNYDTDGRQLVVRDFTGSDEQRFGFQAPTFQSTVVVCVSRISSSFS